jgi:acetyl esterase/lipase
MKRLTKRILKALSGASIQLNTHYKVYRKVQDAANPVFRPAYKMLDLDIVSCGRKVPVRVFYPRKARIPKIIIFFHGGGWVTGDIDSYTKVCAHMADATGHIVVSVDYRLAPEHPYPAGLEDCYQAAREIILAPELMHCEKNTICLMGDSAGGNLAAAVSLLARDRGEFLPRRQILLYPSVYPDHSADSPFASVRENGTDYILTSERLESYMKMYVPNAEDRRSPYVSPLLADDLSDQPDTLIITAQYDPLRDEGEAYGEKLRRFGNRARVFRMDGALHGFLTLPAKSKTVQQCYTQINEFLSI